MDTGIIIALISGAISVGTGIFNYTSIKSQAKKASTEAEDILMSRAMALNKQEIETLRIMNEQLRSDAALAKAELIEKEKDNEELKRRVSELEIEVKELKSELKNCMVDIERFKKDTN